MNPNYLDFEQPIAELEAKIEELRYVGDDTEVNIGDEIGRLEEKSRSLTKTIFNKLTSWQTSKLARHPMRPYTLDYIDRIFTDFQELHGDRAYGDDPALVGGLARLDEQVPKSLVAAEFPETVHFELDANGRGRVRVEQLGPD